jgi:hypothetical protein
VVHKDRNKALVVEYGAGKTMWGSRAEAEAGRNRDGTRAESMERKRKGEEA